MEEDGAARRIRYGQVLQAGEGLDWPGREGGPDPGLKRRPPLENSRRTPPVASLEGLPGTAENLRLRIGSDSEVDDERRRAARPFRLRFVARDDDRSNRDSSRCGERDGGHDRDPKSPRHRSTVASGMVAILN